VTDIVTNYYFYNYFIELLVFYKSDVKDYQYLASRFKSKVIHKSSCELELYLSSLIIILCILLACQNGIPRSVKLAFPEVPI